MAQSGTWGTHTLEAVNGWSAFTRSNGARRAWFCRSTSPIKGSAAHCSVLQREARPQRPSPNRVSVVCAALPVKLPG